MESIEESWEGVAGMMDRSAVAASLSASGAAPAAGAATPAAATTSLAVSTGPLPETPPGVVEDEGGEVEGGETAPVAGAATPAAATTSLAMSTGPVPETPPGIVEDDGGEERAAWPGCIMSTAAAGGKVDKERARATSGGSPGCTAAAGVSTGSGSTGEESAISAAGRRVSGIRRVLQSASSAPAARRPALQNWATCPVVPQREQRRRKASV